MHQCLNSCDNDIIMMFNQLPAVEPSLILTVTPLTTFVTMTLMTLTLAVISMPAILTLLPQFYILLKKRLTVTMSITFQEGCDFSDTH